MTGLECTCTDRDNRDPLCPVHGTALDRSTDADFWRAALSTLKAPHGAAAEGMEHVVPVAGGVMHLARCEPCQVGDHCSPPRWHSWAGRDDMREDDPEYNERVKQQRCACSCAHGLTGNDTVDRMFIPEEWAENDPDLEGMTNQNEPCTECGETSACGYDAEGRPMFHRQRDDDE